MEQTPPMEAEPERRKPFLQNSDGAAFSRRRFLRGGALTVAGATGLASFSVNEAEAWMECLTEKLKGKYPIGKTMVVGNEVVPAGSTTASVSSGMVPSRSDTQTDPMKFLTAFDYGKATARADGTSKREYLVVVEDKEIESPKV